MARSIIEILLRAKNNASGAIQSVNHELEELDSKSKRAGNSLNTIGKAFAAGGIALLANQVKEIGNSGADLERLRTSFMALTAGVGEDGSKMLGTIKRVSAGTISEYDAMLSANRAMLLGVADSTTEMQALVEIAMARGRAMGLSTQEAFNDIVTGIGRMSPLILDNLGITINAESVFREYAATLGITAEDLSDTEKKQALLNATLANSADIIASTKKNVVDSGVAYERLTTSVDDLKRALGETANELILVEAASTASFRIEQWTGFIDVIREGSEQRIPNMVEQLIAMDSELHRLQSTMLTANKVERAWMEAEANSIRMNRQLYVSMLERVKATQGVTDSTEELISAALSAMNSNLKLADTSEEVGFSIDEAGEAAKNAAADFGYLGSVAIATSSDIASLDAAVSALKNNLANVDAAFSQANALRDKAGRQLLDSALEVADIVGQSAAIELYEQQAAALWDGSNALKQQGLTTNELIFATAALADEAGAPLQSIIDQNKEVQDTAKNVSSLNAEYSSLKSTVEGIISGAIGPVAGVDAEDFLPRADAVNENARRIADIMVNGLTGQDWLDELKREVPEAWAEIANSDDPKQAAARILKDFQDGLRPDLIDAGRAKELVKRAIIGDETTSALIDSIAKDLANELGISVSAAQKKAQEVLGGGTAGGSSSSPQELYVKPIIEGGNSVQMTAVIETIDYGDLTNEAGGLSLPEITITAKIAAVDETALQDITGFHAPIPVTATIATVGLSGFSELDGYGENDPITLKSEFSVPSTRLIDLAVSEWGPIPLKSAITSIDTTSLGIAATELGAIPLSATIGTPTLAANAGYLVTAMLANQISEGQVAAINVVPVVDAANMDFLTPRTHIIESMPLGLTPFIDTLSVGTTEAAFNMRTALNGGLVLTPTIDTTYVDFLTAATSITTGLNDNIALLAEDIQAAGAVFMSHFYVGITGSNIGASIATHIDTSMTLNKTLLAASANTAGTTWGDAFLAVVGDNVPPALIQILTSLITPAVVAELRAEESTTGA